MKGKIGVLYKDKFLRYTSALTIVTSGFATTLVLVFYSHLPPLVPIFNSMPWGERRLYESEFTISFPIVLFLIVLVNAFFAIVIYKKFTLLSRILSFTSFLFCLLGLLAYLQILFLVY